MISAEIWHDLAFISAPFCDACGHPFAYVGQGHDPHLGSTREITDKTTDTQAAQDTDLEKDQNLYKNGSNGCINAPQMQQNEGMICAHCIKTPPHYNKHRSALMYNDVSRRLVMMFKHGDHLHTKNIFIPWLEKTGHELLAEADLIIPVPLHYFRLVKRRYNQAAVLATSLSKATGIPCNLSSLIRTKATASQGHKNAKQRQRNVGNAFKMRPVRTHSILPALSQKQREKQNEQDIKGKTILLIDDVYTTGATVNACARTLKTAGAKAVHVLTIAKTARQ